MQCAAPAARVRLGRPARAIPLPVLLMADAAMTITSPALRSLGPGGLYQVFQVSQPKFYPARRYTGLADTISGMPAPSRAPKSYDQYCPVARSLDVLGERWTLLIVRDLMTGPKRYTDLRQGLPGIAPGLLTARLPTLEGAGLVARRELPRPAPATVSELTA